MEAYYNNRQTRHRMIHEINPLSINQFIIVYLRRTKGVHNYTDEDGI